MPCQCDHMDATEREKESRRVCRLLAYLIPRLEEGAAPSEDVIKAKDNYYGDIARLDEHTAILCASINGMTEEHKNSVMYDGRNKEARELASWWEEHQEMDAKRKESKNPAG